ncbi:hypothetical protein [Rathayibacter sp. VKM Ac-2630]|uniref:hypothetical protein n=1 Tax=Rathayibacter sp. VKM Ac-2630 TaxID=1938617 RepID=UPI001F1FA30D|nr:hypothetical protein [Rathayibacter sp. VKM Ac-2630]
MSAFFQWLASIPPLAQIPLILLAFAAVVAIILFFVEVAPRRGTGYTLLRLAVTVLLPVVLLLAFGLYNSVMWVAVVAAVLGGALFLLDFRSRKGAGYGLQLVAFMAPAAFFILIGLIYPTITTALNAFMKNDGSGFAGLDNFVWVFTSPDASPPSSTRSSGCSSPRSPRRPSASRTPSSSTRAAARSSSSCWSSCRWRSRSSARRSSSSSSTTCARASRSVCSTAS